MLCGCEQWFFLTPIIAIKVTIYRAYSLGLAQMRRPFGTKMDKNTPACGLDLKRTQKGLKRLLKEKLTYIKK